MTFQLFNFDDIHVRSMTVDGLVYFAAKEIGQALEYVDIPCALKAHVDPEYTTTFGELQQSTPTACLSGPVGFTGPTETRLRGLVDANLSREVAQRTWFILARSVVEKAFRQEVQEVRF